ncbi:hydrogenase expression/formation protein HypE [Desulfothermus sp.]
MKRILLDHGSGGLASNRLISEIFIKHLSNEILDSLDDAAYLEVSPRLSFSTDTYTIDPIFFPGGDIGSLCVSGTVNDIAMLGARPKYLSCGFIIEEGFLLSDLEKIVKSMAHTAQKAGVLVVTGDTKVVPKGSVDKIFINTSGIGELVLDIPLSGKKATCGDKVIINGTIGDHGLAIFTAREGLDLNFDIKSDCAPMNNLILKLIENIPEIHVMRDPTRGGVATTLNEIAIQSNVCIELFEDALPITSGVKEGCDILGLDPLYLANEGKFICILPEKYVELALEILREDHLGKHAALIGEVTDTPKGKVVLNTKIGGKRLLSMLEGEHLPRIC